MLVTARGTLSSPSSRSLSTRSRQRRSTRAVRRIDIDGVGPFASSGRVRSQPDPWLPPGMSLTSVATLPAQGDAITDRDAHRNWAAMATTDVLVEQSETDDVERPARAAAGRRRGGAQPPPRRCRWARSSSGVHSAQSRQRSRWSLGSLSTPGSATPEPCASRTRWCWRALAWSASARWLRIGFDGALAASVVGGVGLGWLLSGAAFLAMAWFVRPALVGGGDWKLLTALGAAIGLVAPLAAMCVLLIAAPVGLAVSALSRGRRCVPMAPGLALGYVVALVLVGAWPNLLGAPK